MPRIAKESLAQMLKRLRLEKGVSVSTVARRTGISRAYLSELENGQQLNPSGQKIAALATYYKEEPRELLYDAPSRQEVGMPDTEWSELVSRIHPSQRLELAPILRRYAELNRAPDLQGDQYPAGCQ